MAVRLRKPVTNAQRGLSVDDFSDVTKKTPEKSLLTKKKKRSGRNNQGKITVRHQGGGVKQKYRIIDFKMLSGEYTVEAIEYDPNRSARIALLSATDGKKSYILSPLGLKVGKKIRFGEEANVATGHRRKLADLPVGTLIYNIELNPGQGGKLVRSAGASAQLMAKEGELVQIKLPSSEIRKVSADCMASVGTVSNPEYQNIKLGKAGRVRKMGKRPTVRGSAMNPVDHPHGGGEGNQPIGLKHPKTPWGAPALGVITRKKKKPSTKFIVRKRKKRRGK
ncbi:MAG: 50S ribosomal protein L2 [Patescibacteria group bacterium]|nr:50S ribosomal protein L2 [Patescibacteria group bacterium]